MQKQVVESRMKYLQGMREEERKHRLDIESWQEQHGEVSSKDYLPITVVPGWTDVFGCHQSDSVVRITQERTHQSVIPTFVVVPLGCKAKVPVNMPAAASEVLTQRKS